jgi:predicted enzyme related to lactoylglutathione lyase
LRCNKGLAQPAPRRVVDWNGEETGMAEYPGRFAWYELMTTDVAAARAFYADVVGWDVQDDSMPHMAYSRFLAGKTPVGGLMELPKEAREKGATPRWMGYVAVGDVDAAVDRVMRLGGAVYVPPTDSNIGRISVVADPQMASLALVGRPKPDQAEADVPGHVGWHELLAADWEKAFAFYRSLFGWRKAAVETTYQLFSAGGQTIGGMCTKPPLEPVPFWLFYFNVGDIDVGGERVTAGGGTVFEDPFELPDGSWVARCMDPQGAIFALQGKRRRDGAGRGHSEFGWSAEWSGISSRGRLVTKPRG